VIIGADIDVPLEYPYVLPFRVENIEDPGAEISTLGEKFE
jgi:hypothetical protein